MSLLIGRLSEREIVLCADTAVVGVGGQIGHASKALHLPHLGILFGTVGHTAFCRHLCEVLQTMLVPGFAFDGLLPLLPSAVAEAHENLLPIIAETGQADINHAFFFGWSRARRRMLGMSFSNYDFSSVAEVRSHGATFQQFAANDGWFAWPPVPPAQLDLIIGRSRKAGAEQTLKELAQTQRNLNEDHRRSLGGRLIMMTMSQFKTETRQIFEWPDSPTGMEDDDDE